MKKLFVSLLLIGSSFIHAQTSNKVAVVDMDFILKKSPEYVEANKELQKRAKEWEQVVQKRKVEIKKLRDQLAIERPLLTQQLIDEKDEEIQLLEVELLSYQQSKFGIDGDYFAQKINLAKPIQDQIYTIVNDLAEKKKYTMVLDKNDSSNSMLYAKKNSDITDLVLRELEKTRNRGKMSKKEIAALDAQEKQQDQKDRQRTKREELAERQRDLEAEGKSTVTAPGNTSNAPIYSEADRRKKEAEDKLAAIKAKQDEIRETKLKQIEERKKDIERKQEEVRLAREKALKDAELRKEKLMADRQRNIDNKTSGTNQPSTTAKQNLSDAQLEAQRKREEILKQKEEEMNRRRKEVEERKKEVEKLKEEKRKEAEKRREESLKKREEALKNRSQNN